MWIYYVDNSPRTTATRVPEEGCSSERGESMATWDVEPRRELGVVQSFFEVIRELLSD